MQKKRASMHDGPLADLFRATDAPAASPPAGPPPPTEEPAREPTTSGGSALGDLGLASPPPAPGVLSRGRAPAATPEPPPATVRARQPSRAAVRSPEPSPTAVRSPLYASTSGAGAYLAIIRVVGVGGAGVNAVNRMIEAGIEGVEFLALNTDLQQLGMSDAGVKIHLGRNLTSGLGSGSDAEIGRRAAEEADRQIREALRGSDLVFVAAGEGGGTGSGAAPVVARIARELGALTVGIVTTPFRFEGARRRAEAETGIERLAASVDTLVTIPNDRLLQVLDRRTSMVDAFRVADDILRQGVQGICDLITKPGLINLDFADVRTIMKDAGSALMGVGMASGPNSAREAARLAVHSPLIGHEIRGATGILLSVSGGESLSLHDAMEIAQIVREAADDSCNIIFGATVDPDLRDQLWVTVIATGFADGATSQANVTAPASAPLGRDARAEASTGPGRVPVANGVELPPFLAQP